MWRRQIRILLPSKDVWRREEGGWKIPEPNITVTFESYFLIFGGLKTLLFWKYVSYSVLTTPVVILDGEIVNE